VTARPAAGGGRWVEVAPERLTRWFDGFADRHGPFHATHEGDVVTVTAEDGTVAYCSVPFPPLAISGGLLTSLTIHAMKPRRIAVLLVRLGGYATGVFDGTKLVVSKVDSRLVHGRNKKGGSSSGRFARRRENQARDALDDAAATAVRVLLPYAADVEAVVTGGDHHAVDAVLTDPRLEPLRRKVSDRFLAVPDPKRAILDTAPGLFRAVRIRVVDIPPVTEPAAVTE
jgi:hypothetical protein